MAEKASQRNLDDLDLKLISELETEARSSNLCLANKLGVDEKTVRRRLARLLDEQIITFSTDLNATALGYQAVSLAMNTASGQADAVAHELTLRPNVNYVFITSGRYDVMAWAIYEHPLDLFDFVTRDLAAIPHVTSIETMPLLKIMKNSWALLGSNGALPVNSKTLRNLDEEDWALLTELEDNPRATNTYLAKQLGVSRATAGARLQKLLDYGVVQISGMAKRSALGYSLVLGVLIKAQPDRILDAAQVLMSHTAVHRVFAISGRFDLMILSTFQSSEGMSHFLKNQLGTISGIVSYETILHLESVKGSFSVRGLRASLQQGSAP